ncbi:hypothetical protein Pmar_PMAR020394 [Perkinsus marinus ATCC 50983]|uniref:Uncharacterized protein n=1 Tax=Perkinsus marinus (strain ATCC 50983 / TXsc) TaxID=423536 RepID=C5L6X3_PERM5|nr:hypothetical protein Pmar_PMAR020394 [Perkinsus marinus ATCC 50983]EER07235.1 hypothetical protein Pmar_PMAR020394 [Perkinsus marinus ATCC 50983]|eukprot:XP_002775419.1 hypothetical protein Pmar_PMAR020394 [Perkinsus marinus ATCC 50983]
MSADEASTVASASLTTTVPSDFTGGFWQTASTDRIGIYSDLCFRTIVYIT